MEKDNLEKYIKAKRRVDNLKNFYAHIVMFLVMNILLFIFKGRMLNFFTANGVKDQGFLNWLEWNMTLIPVIWGVILLVTGVYFLKLKPGFFRKWEERQMRKYQDE